VMQAVLLLIGGAVARLCVGWSSRATAGGARSCGRARAAAPCGIGQAYQEPPVTRISRVVRGDGLAEGNEPVMADRGWQDPCLQWMVGQR
jgi:hypothetical protein